MSIGAHNDAPTMMRRGRVVNPLLVVQTTKGPRGENDPP